MTPAEEQLYDDLLAAYERAFRAGVHPTTAREHTREAGARAAREHCHKIILEDDK